MSGNMRFFYFGDDEAYFRALQGEFKRHTRLVIEFSRHFEAKENQIQSFFNKVFTDKPAVVFIDFSKQTQDYLHLARLLSRTKLEHELVMVGVVDYLSPPEVLTESIATGVNYSFIKSAEIFDVVYSVTRIIAPNECATHGFATGSLSEEWEVGVPSKVGFVSMEGLHIETNMNLRAGEKIKILHHWMEKRTVPSRQVFVKETSSENLYYQFKQSADLEFQFVDEFLPVEGMEEQKIQERMSERQDLILHHKKQLKKWVEENLDRSFRKVAKLLVVDYNFRFYQNQPRTDKNLYTIRCLPFFSDDIAADLLRHMPQVIAFELQKEEAASKNTQEVLLKLGKILNSKLQELRPIIVVFNFDADSSVLQESMGYQNVITYPGELSPEVLVKMADMVQKRLPVVPEKKVFINKTTPASIAEIIHTIKVTKISESDLIFESETEIPLGVNLHVRKPVDMYISVHPSKSNGKVPEYFGLIHSIGEGQKKELRKFVNSVFFRDHDAQLQTEAEEFKKLNESKLQERVEKEKQENAEEESKEPEPQAP